MNAAGPTQLLENPSVTVVLPVRDDDRVQLCVRSLLSQTYDGPVQVVVADNGSHADPADGLPDDPRVLVVSVPSGGSYTARNQAISLATGDVIAFTDADCLPASTWLATAVEALHHGADVVAGRVEVFAAPGRLHPVVAYELVHAFPQATYVRRGGGCITANVVTWRRVLESVGPFRDELRSGADIEWGQRAESSGHVVRYVHDAVVRHPARDSFGAEARKIQRVIRGRWERDVLKGKASSSPSLDPAMLRPPVGAIARARRHPGLRRPAAVGALVVGESYVRFVTAWTYLRLLPEQRRVRRDC